MKLPLSLIKSFIDIELEPARIAETLTLLGLEVDGIENEHPAFAGVVVGEVLSTAPHPNATKLTVAEVKDSSGIFQVVCGASNCRPGIKTAFAKPGALLKEPDGKQTKIEKAVLRGVESWGMLCGADELGLPPQGDGIIDLPASTPLDADLVRLLWDPVFEISLTPNLGHCMSALGVARELSAALGLPLRRKKAVLPHASGNRKIDIGPNDALAPRYMCRLIEGAAVGPSPFWLQKQLIASGISPISNAVDAANWIMIALGQPLHVFDFDRLEGGTVRASLSKGTQKFLGLDGVERDIPPGTLLISDAKQPAAIAGVLGGAESAVSDKTKNLLIEAAVFDPAAIRQTMKKTGLRTESSQRFEKGIDPLGTPDALDEAAALILELCGGKIASEATDVKKADFPPKTIPCRIQRVNALLGTRLSLGEIEGIFRSLGFESKETGGGALQVKVPPRRSDISEEIDLVEEAARIYGYNNIEKKPARGPSSSIPHDPAYLFEKEIRETLAGFGLQEFLNSDLIGKKLAELALEWVRRGASLLSALHAKTEEYSVLRPSLLPGLLQSAKRNFNFKNHSFAAFEIGRIHFLQNEQLVEEPMAALVLTGKNSPLNWSESPSDFDFYDLKGILENLFDSLRLPPIGFESSAHPSFHPGRQANIALNGQLLGSFGEIHPALLEASDLKQRLYYAEINLHLLMQLPRRIVRMKPLPQFPSSERDWTVSLPLSTCIGEVFEAIRSLKSLLLEKAELIDLYAPESGAVKNATLRFTYRDPLKTISFEEVENAHTQLIEAVSKHLAK